MFGEFATLVEIFAGVRKCGSNVLHQRMVDITTFSLAPFQGAMDATGVRLQFKHLPFVGVSNVQGD